MELVIINRLLDKYEKSRQATGEPCVRRRVSLKTEGLAEYHGREIDYRKAFHLAAENLQQQGLIQVEWLAGEQGNLIKSLHLNLDRLDAAYQAVGRSPQSELLQQLTRQLMAIKPQREWLQSFLQDCLDEIDRRRFPAQLPREAQKRDWLLASLQGIVANDASGDSTEMLERIFSKRYLGHSKLFEQQVRTRLVGILRRYAPLPELDEDDLLLLEAGLVRASGEVLLRGPLTLRLKGRGADVSSFVYGVALGPETLSEMEIESCAASRLLSVENKATFRELIRCGLDENVLLLCLGGFAGASKRRLLKKLAAYLGEQVSYGHWGDLDYGGLQIFQHLRQTCLPQLRPELMDADTYRDFVSSGEPFDDSYRRKLERLREQDGFGEFHDLLDAMLLQGKTLEQEAVPVERLAELEKAEHARSLATRLEEIKQDPLGNSVEWRSVRKTNV